MPVCVILAIITIFMLELCAASLPEKKSSHQEDQELTKQTTDRHRSLTHSISDLLDFETTVDVATAVLPIARSLAPNYNMEYWTDMISEGLVAYLPKEGTLSFLLPQIGDKSRNAENLATSRSLEEDWETEMLLYSVLTLIVVLGTPLGSLLYLVLSGLAWLLMQVVLVLAIQQGFIYYFSPDEPVLLPVVKQVYSFFIGE